MERLETGICSHEYRYLGSRCLYFVGLINQQTAQIAVIQWGNPGRRSARKFNQENVMKIDGWEG